jgi:D-arabinose 1-dehydrogenase-like Zn-dependent alcohol dehydrogenase
MKHSHPHNQTMKAVEFEGKPFSMSVKTVPVPKVTQPTDAVVRITSSGICGKYIFGCTDFLFHISRELFLL